MDNKSPGRPQLKRGLRKLVGGVATSAVVASSLVIGGLGATAASAAVDPLPTTISTVGAFSNVVVPTGVCSVEIVALGAGGGSPSWNGSTTNQAQGGAGARIAATFDLANVTSLSGYVGGGGKGGSATSGRKAGGSNTGGAGGEGTLHHGGGGGGLTSVAIDGTDVVVAGAGGGAGGGHRLGSGSGGHGGLPTGAGVAAGQDGESGGDSSDRGRPPYIADPTMTPGGGQGGQAGAPGAGGDYTDTDNKLPAAFKTSILGQPGVGQTGGAGGINPSAPGGGARADTGGGGGGGFTGGGGGTDTYENGAEDAINNGIGAAGGGGGSSFVAANASDVASVQGTRAGNAADGSNGQVQFIWKACADPEITLEKTADKASFEAGDEIEYTFDITNSGEVALSNVVLTDELPGLIGLKYVAWPGAPANDPNEAGNSLTLLPGEIATATAKYTATHEDVNTGQIVNSAKVVGTSPEDVDVEDTDAVTLTGPEHGPAMSLVKEANTQTFTVGHTVTYTFTAGNTGNVTLTDVTIVDPLSGLFDWSYTWPGAPGTLQPGQNVTATAKYVTTQADVDAGTVYNKASATGTPPAVPGEEPPAPLPPVEDDVTIISESKPGLAIVKDVSSTTFALGQTLTYTFTVQNTGNVTLNNVTIDDPLPGLLTLIYTWPGADGVLVPGQTASATATYTATQADVDRGFVNNAATSTGIPPVGPNPEVPAPPVTTPPSKVTVEGPVVDPAISLEKTGALSVDENTATYTFVATNTGNVTLSDVTITDESLPGLSAIVYGAWPGAAGVLAPGESITGTASYSVTQADRNAGAIVNTADTEGTAPEVKDPKNPEAPGTPGEKVTDTDPNVLNLTQTPAINLVKTGALADVSEAASKVGDIVEYTFVATNTGNVRLTDVEINDPLAGLTPVAIDWSTAATEGQLDPNESVTGTATYKVTQGDIDYGSVLNTATVAGQPPVDPKNPEVPAEPVTDEDDVIVALTPAPAIDLVKTSKLDGKAQAGDTVTYEFTGTNTGNVTLNQVVISDPLPGLGEISYSWPGTKGVLAPGESVTATAPYTLTQADVDAGKVDNTAAIIGTPPATFDPENPDRLKPHDPVTEEDTDSMPLPATPAIDLVKTGKVTAKGLVGDKVEYTFVATNTGNVTLSGVEITDPLKGLSKLSYQWKNEAGVLAPGESVTATASYVLTEADVKAGSVVNTAHTIGFVPNSDDPVGGESVTDKDSVTLQTGKPLANTGDVAPFVAAAGGLGLLLLGAGVMIAARRRKLHA